MQRIFENIGWTLVILAIASIIINFSFQLDLLKNAAISAGVLLSLSGHFFTQARAIKDSTEKSSKFYLESCVKGYEEAEKFLSDGNNNRVKWIAAGRTLMHAKELSKKITLDEHILVLNLNKIKYRNVFYEALKDKPIEFFSGIKDSSITTADAATLPTTNEELSEKFLYAVWEATQWPEESENPLERIVFSEAEKMKIQVIFPGLYEYLDQAASLSTNQILG
ncbi:MAG: hypothetical protein PHF31_03525 [Methylobacter sp.]|nr:hypothetical protein [Methylobacter sp.]